MCNRITILAALALFVFVGANLAPAAPADDPAPANADPSNVGGLKISVDRARNGEVDVTFQNVDKKAMVLNLGIVLGKGPRLMPIQLHLIVSGSDGKPRQLSWKGPPGVAGSLDDFLVPLMPSARYTLTLSLSDLIDDGDRNDIKKATLAAGEKVKAVYEGVNPAHPNGGPNWTVWTDKVESNSLTYSQ